jgi:hypothetical protein
MVLQSSGGITFSQIRNELKGSGSSGGISMSQLYDNNSNYLACGLGLPNSGTGISFSSMYSKQKTMLSGLNFKTFSQGYFADDVGWTTVRQYTAIGLVTDFTNISNATNANYYVNYAGAYTAEWFGYFRANVTGTWTFTVNSDDASYLWVGSVALNGWTTGNTIAKSPSTHPNGSEVAGTISLTSGSYYPIRMQYGNGSGNSDCQFTMTPPSGTKTTNWAGYVFSSLGGNASYPAENAKIIKDLYTTNALNGTYYVNCAGVGTKTYCLMDPKYDGGGWMMIMKATRGTTFPYSSTYWTAVNTLNPTDTTLNDADAKFDTFNNINVKDLLAIFPDAGYTGGGITSPDTGYWTWLVNNCYSSGTKTTPLTIFGTYSVISTTPLSNPNYSANIWSTEGGYQAFLINANAGFNTPIRWGFLWNNEFDWGSIDVGGGIGMNSTQGSYSAGDFIGCCQTSTGLNRSMRAMVFAR